MKTWNARSTSLLASLLMSLSCTAEEGETRPLTAADQRLFMAAQEGASALAALEEAVSEGANVNARSPIGSEYRELIYGTGGATPLMIAAAYGHLECVKLLLKRGAAVDATTYKVAPSKAHVGGLTALMLAASKGHEEIVNLLVAAGADVLIRSANGRNALGEAIASPRVDAREGMIRSLLIGGADPNQPFSKGQTPLVAAILHGNPAPVLDLLIQYGADVNLRTRFSSTPLRSAIDHGGDEHVKILLAHGARE